jgi:PleD family two-component response regulator
MSLETKPRLRVLVVDDEQKLTDLLRLELDVEGYDVQVAGDGASGLFKARPIQPQTSSSSTGIFRTSVGSIFVNAFAPTV